MLTADLVDARRKDGELLLRPLDDEGRAEARAIATVLLETAKELVGRQREELEEAWEAATADTNRVKMAAGLRKLAADACLFEAETDVDPTELRRILFTHASEVRRVSEAGAFERVAVVADAARMLGIAPDVLERAMFSDLRSEHVLRAAPTVSAASLVESWELGQAQAVLLAAVRVTCEITSKSPGLVRALFAKLKFHQLLFTAERTAEGFSIVIDGPYSMFDAVTKYGLKLALLLGALRSLERWSLTADIRWGKAKEPLVFRLASTSLSEAAAAQGDESHVSDEVRELASAIEALGEWRARPATAVLDVPGRGLCIPDLELSRGRSKKVVYVEVLGYWSRDAVFKRVELAESGALGAPVIFAVSSRLRVSAELLDKDAPSSLYVYKGKMSPRAIVAHAELLAAQPRGK